MRECQLLRHKPSQIGRLSLDEKWPHGLLTFFHDFLAAQLGPDFFQALLGSVDNLALLRAIAAVDQCGPEGALELVVKAQDADWMHEVDEGEADATLCLQVLWQVEVVVAASKLLIDELEHQVLVELYWDVLEHECCLCQQIVAADWSLVQVIGLASEKERIEVNKVDLWSFEFLLLRFRLHLLGDLHVNYTSLNLRGLLGLRNERSGILAELEVLLGLFFVRVAAKHILVWLHLAEVLCQVGLRYVARLHRLRLVVVRHPLLCRLLRVLRRLHVVPSHLRLDHLEVRHLVGHWSDAVRDGVEEGRSCARICSRRRQV